MLLVVESPAKAKKIQTFFNDDTIVLSSCGHINNLAKKNLGIDTKNNFKPSYEYLPDKKDIIKKLRDRAKDHKIILAADDDREGDAIAWHCGNLLKVKFNQKNRIIFHEINQKSIQKSLKNIHKINMNSVYSQQARQIIDKLIGFKLSPLLWENIQTDQKGLSAGRVQSTLLLILKNLEDSIQSFEAESEYQISGNLLFNENQIIECSFIPQEEEIDPERILHLFKENKSYRVSSLKHNNINDYPPKPFITSSLQQTAYNNHGFSIKKTMMIAQKLYENGKITYMRSDSTFISKEFQNQLQDHINQQFSPEYYYDPKEKMKKVKGAQEAHECVRVTQVDHTLNDKYSEDDHKLYNLIKKRTITSHMKPAIYHQMIVQLSNSQIQSIGIFEGKHKNLIFDGYLKYSDVKLTKELTIDDTTNFNLLDAACTEIVSQPPPHFNESSLVKKLESSGIGRPSTYSSIISTLYNRNYTIVKNIEAPEYEIESFKLSETNEISHEILKTKHKTQKKKILLTPLGFQVLDYLLTHFDNIINIQFTSLVEKDLDLISQGELVWHEVVKKVYDSFYQKVDRLLKRKPFDDKNLGKYKKKDVCLKKGQYGPYLRFNNKNISLSSFIRKNKLSLDTLKITDIQSLLH
jgi:DNA topoisomerase I